MQNVISAEVCQSSPVDEVRNLIQMPVALPVLVEQYVHRLDLALEKVDTIEAAGQLLDATALVALYLDQQHANVALCNQISKRTTKIQALIGRLLAPAKGGRGKRKTLPTVVRVFSKRQETTFRKLAAHEDEIDSYFGSLGDEERWSLKGFLRSVMSREQRQGSAKRLWRISRDPLGWWRGEGRAMCAEAPFDCLVPLFDWYADGAVVVV